MDAEQRIENLEAALGASLPVTYRAFLRSHREEPSRPVQVVSTNPDYWDVSCIFEIGDAEDYLQLDGCYELVGDVLPEVCWQLAKTNVVTSTFWIAAWVRAPEPSIGGITNRSLARTAWSWSRRASRSFSPFWSPIHSSTRVGTDDQLRCQVDAERPVWSC